MIKACVQSLLILDSTVTNRKHSLLLLCGNAPCPPLWLYSLFLPNSTARFLRILFYFSSLFAYHPVFCAKLIWLELLLTSIPWAPISSTHLTYLIITTQGKGVRAVSIMKTKEKINSDKVEKPSMKLASFSTISFLLSSWFFLFKKNLFIYFSLSYFPSQLPPYVTISRQSQH